MYLTISLSSISRLIIMFIEHAKDDIPADDNETSTPYVLAIQAEHITVPVSVCSNVPGYTEPKFFVLDDRTSVVSSKVEYIRNLNRSGEAS